MRRVARLPVVLALALLAAPLAAQQAERPWTASLAWSGDRFEDATPSWEDWSAWELAVARRFTSGSVAIEGGRFERFGRTDGMGGLDLYRELWSSSYANARIRVAPEATGIARSDVLLELFQGLPGGWEPSLSYRQMRFSDRTVRIVSGSAARYVGRWVGRVRLAHARTAGEGGTSVGALLRRTLRSESEMIEIAAATGTEVVTLPGAGPASVELRGTTEGSLGARVHMTPALAIAGNVGHTVFEGIPDRTSLRAGVVIRW